MAISSAFEISLSSPHDTRRLGFCLAELVSERAMVALNGPLGAGKTTFAQGAAEALGVQEVVNSPTFTMINEYTSGRLPFCHLDLYRLQEDSTTGGAHLQADPLLLEAELDELKAAPGLILIEWAEYFSDYIEAQDHITVALNYSTLLPGADSRQEAGCETGRTASIAASGEQASKIVEALRIVYFS